MSGVLGYSVLRKQCSRLFVLSSAMQRGSTAPSCLFATPVAEGCGEEAFGL